MTRASVAVKRIPCSATKNTRYKASVNDMNKKFYSLEVVPLDVYGKSDEAIARFIAETYCKDRDLQWSLSELSTIHKGEYIFIAM